MAIVTADHEPVAERRRLQVNIFSSLCCSHSLMLGAKVIDGSLEVAKAVIVTRPGEHPAGVNEAIPNRYCCLNLLVQRQILSFGARSAQELKQPADSHSVNAAEFDGCPWLQFAA